MNLPWKKIHWLNSTFLIGTFLTTLIAVPAYIWHFGLDAFQIGLFVFLAISTGLSITLGYHRLFLPPDVPGAVAGKGLHPLFRRGGLRRVRARLVC